MPKNRRGKATLPPTQELSQAQLNEINKTGAKLRSLLITPQFQNYISSGFFRGVREKIVSVNFATIRNLVERVPLISAIIQTRIDQVQKFCRYEPGSGHPGYEFYLTDPNKKVTPEIRNKFFQLAEFIANTGWDEDSEREDDFADYVSMFTRETLSIDQVATELQRDVKGDIAAYWLLDGATIHRVDPSLEKNGINVEVEFQPDTRFAQIIDNQICNEYSPSDLLFDYKNKRADIRFRGFGYAPTEQAIDVITTLLFGYSYLRDQMVRDKMPKGFISVMGDVGKDQLDDIRDYWYAAMSGAGGQFNLPILPSGKDGVGIEFKAVGNQSNRDMEYHKMMMFLSSIISAVFSIDLAEMGIKADDSTALIGESDEPRLQYSRDRGLASVLSFIEQHINKILRKIDSGVRFRFVGLEREDEQKQSALRESDLRTYKSVDELRKADGLEPYDEEWSQMPLNQFTVQMSSAAKQQQQQGAQGSGGAGEQELSPEEQEGAPGEEAADNAQDEGHGAEIDWSKMFTKSLRDGRSVKIVIE